MNQFTPALIYNLFPLLAGPIRDWRPHLERAAGMGFNWVFLNPLSCPGSSGSLYSVKDFYALNPAVTGPDCDRDIREVLGPMLESAHGLGLRVMLDLVVNHTAVDSPLVEQHPDWYARDGKGQILNPWAIDNGRKVVWEDLADIDNANSPDREALRQWWWELVRFHLELGFDGFRCDAAYKVPTGLWERLIGKSRKEFPGTVFFAESLGCSEQQTVELAGAGFDYIFNSSKWWDFQADWALEQYEQSRGLAPSVSFPESHDTERLYTELKGDTRAFRQRAAFSALFSTGFMIPIGFEYAFAKKLHVVKTTLADWEEPNLDLTGFLKDILAFKLAHEIFCFEHPTCRFDLNPDSGNVTGLIKLVDQSGPSALLLINRDRVNAQRVVVHRLDYGLPGKGEITLLDPLDNNRGIPLYDYSLDAMLPPAGLWVALRGR